MRWVLGLALLALGGSGLYAVVGGAFSKVGVAFCPLGPGLSADTIWTISTTGAGVLSASVFAVAVGCLVLVHARRHVARRWLRGWGPTLQAGMVLSAIASTALVVALYVAVREGCAQDTAGAIFVLAAGESIVGLLIAAALCCFEHSAVVYATTLTLQLLVGGAMLSLVIMGSGA